MPQLFGNVNNIEPFAGLFAEDHLSGYNVGETLLAVFSDQFKRAGAGDRSWYERTLNGDDLDRVRHTRLSAIIKRNTAIDHLQDNVFFVPGFSQPIADHGN